MSELPLKLQSLRMKYRQMSFLSASLTGMEALAGLGLLPRDLGAMLPVVWATAGGTSACECAALLTKTRLLVKMQRTAVLSTRELRSSPPPLRFQDESISVYLKEVFNILPAETLEKFFLIETEMVGPLAGGSEGAVPLEEMLADVKLGAGGAESAGAVRPVALVVMGANLCRARETQPRHTQTNNPLRSLQGGSPGEAGRGRSAATAGTVVSLSSPEDPDSSKPLGFSQKTDCGGFYTCF